MLRAIFILLILLHSQIAIPQGLFAGLGVSASNYSGDLTRDNKAIIRQTSPGFGLHGVIC